MLTLLLTKEGIREQLKQDDRLWQEVEIVFQVFGGTMAVISLGLKQRSRPLRMYPQIGNGKVSMIG